VRRYALRADKTQGAVCKALRAAGCTVVPIRGPRGLPDLLVGVAGSTALLEVKSPRALRKDGSIGLSDKLATEDQALWRARWRGAPVHVVSTPEQALEAVGVK
jgi:hypothetical protein